MQKKVIAGIVAVLLIVVVVLAAVNRNSGSKGPGMTISYGDNEIAVAWEDIDAADFEGDLVNGKGETSHHEFTGAELSVIFSENGVELTDDSKITATAEDSFSAELSGKEVLEAGKVYVALTDNGEMIEGIEGGQGAQLVVFGDPNSKRAVRYLKTLAVE